MVESEKYMFFLLIIGCVMMRNMVGFEILKVIKYFLVIKGDCFIFCI